MQKVDTIACSKIQKKKGNNNIFSKFEPLQNYLEQSSVKQQKQ